MTAATTLAFAWKDPGGDGHFWLLRGADAQLSEEDADAAGIAKLAALVVGSVALSAQPARKAIERAVGLARQAGVPVVFDVNLRPTLWSDLASARPACEQVARLSTLVKLSLDDAIGLYGPQIGPDAAVETILSLGPSAVVLTDGERGCWFSSGSPATSCLPSGSRRLSQLVRVTRSPRRSSRGRSPQDGLPSLSRMCDMPPPRVRWRQPDPARGMDCRIEHNSTQFLARQ